MRSPYGGGIEPISPEGTLPVRGSLRVKLFEESSDVAMGAGSRDGATASRSPLQNSASLACYPSWGWGFSLNQAPYSQQLAVTVEILGENGEGAWTTSSFPALRLPLLADALVTVLPCLHQIPSPERGCYHHVSGGMPQGLADRGRYA